jgi:hypothetical protein
VRRVRSAGCLGNFCMPVAVGAERAARGENSAGLECDAERTARIGISSTYFELTFAIEPALHWTI